MCPEENPLSVPVERVVVVSGLSGAGKSTALHALEDLGFFCIDNIPTRVVAQVLQECRAGGVALVALGIDVRVRSFLEDFGDAIMALKGDPSVHLSVLFLDANDTALLSRFSATRRPHPLSTATEGEERGAMALIDGITSERARLSRVRVRATHVIDTTVMTVHDLRKRIVQMFGPGVGRALRLRVRVLTFGFKYGSPTDADLVLDVRFLRNPYFEESLREKTGLDEDVVAYVLSDQETLGFVDLADKLVAFCVPRYEREGKAYLTIAVGCTGGRHRSVAIGVELARRVQLATGFEVDVVHRDIRRDTGLDRATDPDIIGGGGWRGTGRPPAEQKRDG
ncbi:MAG: RNase adapter RapZ [Deltaproteobacteria bacterium]|nr:RNase adapter RapZ [Deltaproteobacteria bacterium]